MNDVVQNFDRAVAGYEAHSEPQARLAATLAEIINPAARRGRAIEFGAGMGLFTRRMVPWNGSYLATDAAPNMVARGRVLCPAVQWEQRDAQNPTGLNGVDWIFACNLLQWLDQPESILRQWRKSLGPAGKLAVAVLVDGTLGELRSVLPGAVSPVHWHSTPEWQAMLERAGYRIERAENWEHVSLHPSAREFLRELHAAGLSPRRALGPGRLRAALREYDRRFAVPGGIKATWRGWLARMAVVA